MCENKTGPRSIEKGHEARAIIANHQLKEPAKGSSPAVLSSDTNTVMSSDTDTRNVLTTNQWLSVISIVVNFNGGDLL